MTSRPTVTVQPAIRIGIVDDDPTDRENLRKLIDKNKARCLFEFAVDSLPKLTEERVHKNYRADVILVDLLLRPNEPTGLEVLDYLHALPFSAKNPKPKLVVVSSNTDKFSIELARRAGANGFIRKSLLVDNPTLFLSLMVDMSKVPANTFITKLKDKPKFGLRQCQVLCGLCKDKSQTKIAEELNLAESTVNTYTQELRRQIGGPDMTLFQLTMKAKEWCCIHE